MNKRVYLVSGGFINIIAPLANHLGIPRERVYANTLIFDSNGEFAGVDTEQPTCRSGGKSKVVGMVKNTMSKWVQCRHVGTSRQLVNHVCLLCIITGAISVCMLVRIQGCMCVCMFVYRVVMIGDGATDMEAAPPAVSPKTLQYKLLTVSPKTRTK